MKDVELVPNPTFSTSYFVAAKGFADETRITITDTLGKMVRNVVIDPLSDQSHDLYLSDLPVGIYTVNLAYSGLIKAFKLVKMQ